MKIEAPAVSETAFATSSESIPRAAEEHLEAYADNADHYPAG